MCKKNSNAFHQRVWSGQIANLANWMEVYLFFFLGSSIRLQKKPRDVKICKKYQKIRLGSRKCLLRVRSVFFNTMISNLAKKGKFGPQIWLKIFAKKLILRVTTFLLVMLFKFRPHFYIGFFTWKIQWNHFFEATIGGKWVFHKKIENSIQIMHSYGPNVLTITYVTFEPL